MTLELEPETRTYEKKSSWKMEKILEKIDNTRGCLRFSMFDEDDTEEANSIFKELTRSSFTSTPTANQKFFFTLFRLTKIQLVAKMMQKEFQILLPSDHAWRLKNYFKLLDKQKEKTLIFHTMPPDDGEEMPKWEQVVVSQPEIKKAKLSGSSTASSEGSVVTSQGLDISWNSLDIAKAAKLLGPDSHEVSFHDEDEMRRIYALLYDVFRYKQILSDALRETGFFQKYPEREENVSLVWLLFYDLHKRRFLPRVHADAVLSERSFEKVGLTSIEKDLWACRIKLAASLARARIKNNALRLNQLLPMHLRDERFVSVEETPVTGWINTFQKSKKEICNSIEDLGLKLQSKHETVLTKNDFRFDHLCPKLLLCHPLQRPELAQSSLIRSHTVILQDRAFCLGPALMSKILLDIPLRGIVAQTHVNTPRSTAYLANILVENERLEKLVAFGAGERLLEYQTYLHDLGVTNCEIYAQKFAELHPEAAILENLVAVLATPPNSYTGVTDPVDLICSRGGDMKMLKALTQMKMGEDTLGFLDEQRETLKYCMSLPQVQIILYETHSVAPEENIQMVNNVIETVNGLAKEKHEEEHRLLLEREEAEEKMNKPIFIPGQSSSKEQKEKEKEAQEAKPLTPKEVEVPPCDLFHLVALPELCTHGPGCFTEEGCFLANIQRKEIISLDAKYMIKIAEARGLFGTEVGKKKAGPTRAQKKQERRRLSSAKIKVKRVKLEIDRLAAPTQSTIHKTKKETTSLYYASPSCPRHQSHALDTSNKVVNKEDKDKGITPIMETKKTQRSKKDQEENARRLSRPLTRSSLSPISFSSEVKPRFWKYATAKSIEDLVRALKKKRKGKRIFKVEDYFFFKEEGPPILPSVQKRLNGSETGFSDFSDSQDIDSRYENIYPLSRKNQDTSSTKTNKSTVSNETFITDVEVIKPFINKDVLRITSYGAVSEKSSSRGSPGSKSVVNFTEKEKYCLMKQCIDNASQIFRKIDEAIEENKKLAEKKLKTIVQKKEDPFNQKNKFKNKSFSPLEALSKIEEVSNIIDVKKTNRTDIVLPDKYIPGQATDQQQEFIQALQKKLGKLQQNYQHWTKWQEALSVERLSSSKRMNRKLRK